jgi:hypothetical protein
MTHHRPAPISVVSSSSTPSLLIRELEAIILAKTKLREEHERVSSESSTVRLQWAKDLAQETAKGVNVQSVVARSKELEGKEQRNKEQTDSLARALREIDGAVRYYEQEHRQDLLQALQTRLDQVNEACKEHAELKKWRDLLLRKANTGKTARGSGSGRSARGTKGNS